MRRLILTTVSALALGLGGGLAYAAGDISGNAGPAGTSTPPSAISPSGTSQSTMPPMSGTSMSDTSGRMGSHDEIMEVQRKLQADNLYQGEIDGLLGPQTRQALSEYQRQNGLHVTANLDRETRNHLLGSGSGASSRPPGSATPMTPSTTPAPTHSGGR